jgi:hypothetical protein
MCRRRGVRSFAVKNLRRLDMAGKKKARRTFAAMMVCAAIAAPASAQVVPGGDVFTSDNVEYIGAVKFVGDGVGARVVGDRLYVTSTAGLFIFDITVPENPTLMGSLTADIEFENEDVPTNGKLLGITGGFFSIGCDPPTDAGCLNLYDVSNPAAVTRLSSVSLASHTYECVFDCTWLYGSDGQIVDARDPRHPKVLEERWYEVLNEQGYEIDPAQASGPHDVNEVAPGYLVAAGNNLALMSLNAADGGSPERPALVAMGRNDAVRYMHSAVWPQAGRDKFLLATGETWAIDGGASPCTDKASQFMTFDASAVVKPGGGYVKGSRWTPIDEVRPYNGTYVDGGHPYDVMGCSMHWLEPHPSFHDGGLVAVSAYEHGTRLYQVTPAGKIVEQGYALPVGSEASAPHWAPGGKVFYTVDYARGMDVWRYTGDTYVPTAGGELIPAPGATPGTNGRPADAAPCASAAGFRSAQAVPAGAGVRFEAARRESRGYTIEIFRQSAGRRVLRERRVARLQGNGDVLAWSGRGAGDGSYVARLAMRLASGQRDVRRVTLTRRGGRFRLGEDYFQRTGCGIFRSRTLSSSVFGGTTRRPLGVAYRPAVGVDRVTVTARVGTRVVRSFTGRGAKGRTVTFSIPARTVPRGRKVKVTIGAVRGGRTLDPVTLVARRL